MKMSKKMISAMLAAAMCVSLMAPAWASGKEEITLDTVITEENMYDVFEYLDFTPEHIEKTDRVATRQYTVRDLQYIISLSDYIPENVEIIALPDGNMEVTPLATTGSKNLSHRESMFESPYFLDFVIEYQAIGEYYCNAGECYWTKATPVTIAIKNNNSGYVTDIEILSMSAAAYGMGSYESSYIQMLCSYDVTITIDIFDGVSIDRTVIEERTLPIIFYATDWL